MFSLGCIFFLLVVRGFWLQKCSCQLTASTLRSVPSVFLLFRCTSTRPCSLVFLSIWWLKPFSTVLNSSFLCCTVTPPSQVREGWDPTNMFNPTTFWMYVPVPNQEPVIERLPFVKVLRISFSFIFLHK